jgi:hypothetical protein
LAVKFKRFFELYLSVTAKFSTVRSHYWIKSFALHKYCMFLILLAEVCPCFLVNVRLGWKLQVYHSINCRIKKVCSTGPSNGRSEFLQVMNVSFSNSLNMTNLWLTAKCYCLRVIFTSDFIVRFCSKVRFGQLFSVPISKDRNISVFNDFNFRNDQDRRFFNECP